MFKRLRTAVVLAPALLMAGCATGPRYADMKSSIPTIPAGQGRIYFYRPTALGIVVQPNITLNGEVVGRAQPHGFFYVDRPPGSYEAVCISEGATRKLSFVLEPGQERYVETNVFGLYPTDGTAIPELIDPAVGAKEIVTLHYAPLKPE